MRARLEASSAARDEEALGGPGTCGGDGRIIVT